MIGRLRLGLLRGEGELSEAEKIGLRSFSSISTGLCASGSEGDGRCGRDGDRRIRDERRTERSTCGSKLGGEPEKHMRRMENIQAQKKGERRRLVSVFRLLNFAVHSTERLIGFFATGRIQIISVKLSVPSYFRGPLGFHIRFSLCPQATATGSEIKF